MQVKKLPTPRRVPRTDEYDKLLRWESVDELTRHIHELIDKGKTELALKEVMGFVTNLVSCPSSTAQVFSSPELDNICAMIGRIEYAKLPEPRSKAFPAEPTNIYVVTELAKSGGHSRVLRNFISVEKSAAKHIVLITDTHNRVEKKFLASFLKDANAEILISPKLDLCEKLQWLIKQLTSRHAAKVFYLIHPYDSVAAAAIQFSPQSYFFHNNDHTLSLGVHAPVFAHIDGHPKGFHTCRDTLGIAHNSYWPMAVQDRGFKPREFLKDGKLVTCSAGGSYKFAHFTPYRYNYYDMIPEILEHTGGTHLHIGDIPNHNQRALSEELHKRNIPLDRFIYMPFAPSLWEAIQKYNVDLYIGSFPRGGGMAIVEVLGSGTPVLIHRNYQSVFFTDENEIYPEAFAWRTWEEMKKILSGLTSEILKKHSQLARDYYLKENTMECLSRAIGETKKGGRPYVPPRPRFVPDQLRAFLENREPEAVDHLKQLEAIYNSRCWRITAPLRKVSALFGRKF